MRNKWAKYVLSTECLVKHRKWRFRDDIKEVYSKIFSFNDYSNIIEIGCGPGVLSGQIKKWNPTLNVTAFDIDNDFIDYAKESIQGVNFYVDDISNLSTYDKFDCTISHTVLEFVDTEDFINANKKLLKNNGTMIIICAKQHLHWDELYRQPKLIKTNQFLLDSNDGNFDINSVYTKRPLSGKDIVELLKCNGFDIASIDFVTSQMIIDNYSSDIKRREEIIDIYRTIHKNKLITKVNQVGCTDALYIDECINEIDTYFNDLLLDETDYWMMSVDILMIIKAKLNE